MLSSSRDGEPLLQPVQTLQVQEGRGVAAAVMSSPYAVVNAILGALINVGINVGIAYGLVHGDVGLFHPPPNQPHSHRYNTPVVVDLAITAVLISFLSTAMSTFFIGEDVKKGKIFRGDTRIGPNDGFLWSYYKLYPRIRSTFLRSVVYALVATVTLYGPWVGVWAGICEIGDRDCVVRRHVFTWWKGAFCGIFYVILYPAILLAALDNSNDAEASAEVGTSGGGVPPIMSEADA